MSITALSATTRDNLHAIRMLRREMGVAQRNLATGHRVNTPLDDPNAYFTASKLRGRADALDHRLGDISRGLRTIEAADAGIKAIEAMLNGLGNVARRARAAITAGDATGTPATPGGGGAPYAPPTLSVLGKQLATGPDAAKRAAQTLIGPHQANQIGTKNGTPGRNKDFSRFQFGDGLTGTVPDSNLVGQVAYAPESSGASASNRERFRLIVRDEAGAELGRGEWTIAHPDYLPDGYDLSSGIDGDDVYTVGHLVEAVNRDLGGFVAASITTDGRLRFETKGNMEFELLEKFNNNNNSWDTLTPLLGAPGASGTDRFVFEQGQGATRSTGTGSETNDKYEVVFDPGVMDPNGANAPSGGGGGTAPAAPTTPGTGLMGQWDGYLEQIDNVARDSGYGDLNLLVRDGGAIRISERLGTTLDLAAGDKTVAGLGLSLSAIGFATLDDIDARLAELDEARDRLKAFGARVSSQHAILESRETFSRAMQDTFEAGADDLTLADANEESARLLASRTRLDLATTALSLSGQARPFILGYADGGL